MKYFEYKDYNDYLTTQKKTTDFKYNRTVYVRPATIEKIVDYTKESNMDIKYVMCHGTRSGDEQRHFSSYLPDAEIIGTEICEKARYAPMTEVWDFNQPKDEWLGQFDLVYSNSLDHTNDVRLTLQTWSNQVSEFGLLAIEWSDFQNMKGVTEQDPLNATGSEVTDVMKSLGFRLKDIVGKGQGLARHAGYVMLFSR